MKRVSRQSMRRRTAHAALVATLFAFVSHAGGAPAQTPSASIASTADDAPASAPNPRERRPLPKAPLAKRPFSPHRLIVKFMDHTRARADAQDGSLRFTGAPDDTAPAMVRELGLGSDVRFSPLIRLSADRVDALEARATERSGERAADLLGMFAVDAPEDRLETIAAALDASPLVEFVDWQVLAPPPPCEDAAPPTPQYQPLQGYLGANPGLNMIAAWRHAGARGAEVMVADCEYGYNPGHEDLCGVVPEPGQTIHPSVYQQNWDEHGTAVLGANVGVHNAYGVSGIAPEATALFFPEWTVQGGFRRVDAIANAIATVHSGDVVLLEMQLPGPGGDYGPAELDMAVWTVVKTGTDAGVIVVGAAGNGNQNLDSSAYASYMARGDSGAIIVGAGSANLSHSKLWFSTYGSRVDVQGWGESVFTTGYGSHSTIGGDADQTYTSTFGGTSSASAMIAAAAVAIQGAARAYSPSDLTPQALRQLLVDTGIPQGGGGHIGPFPNVEAAIDVIAADFESDLNGDGLVDGHDLAMLLGSWGPCPACAADLDDDGTIDGDDLTILLGAWG